MCVRKMYVRIYCTVCMYILHCMYDTARYVCIYCAVCMYILHCMYVYTALYVCIYLTVYMYVYIALAPNSYSKLTIRIYSKHKLANAACYRLYISIGSKTL